MWRKSEIARQTATMLAKVLSSDAYIDRRTAEYWRE
jgi:hypothetical protein